MPKRRNLEEVLHLEITPQERTGRARQTREGRGSLLIMFPHFFGEKSANHKWCDASYKIETLLQKAELGSTLRNMLPQLATSKFVAWQVGSEGGNTGNNAFQLAMQQCCATSWAKMLPVFLESASEQDEANPAFWLATRLARSEFPALVPLFAIQYILYFPSLFVQDGWMLVTDFFNLVTRALFLGTRLFFCVFRLTETKGTSQYPAILTSRLANNAYSLAHSR